MGLIKAMDDLPLVLKIILALPGLDIVWAIYRIVKGVCKGKIITLLVGIVWLFAGTTVCWVLDIIFLVLTGKVLFS